MQTTVGLKTYSYADMVVQDHKLKYKGNGKVHKRTGYEQYQNFATERWFPLGTEQEAV